MLSRVAGDHAVLVYTMHYSVDALRKRPSVYIKNNQVWIFLLDTRGVILHKPFTTGVVRFAIGFKIYLRTFTTGATEF